MHTASR